MQKASKVEAISRLAKCRGRIPSLKKLPRFSPEFNKWYRDTQVAIKYVFNDPDHLNDFKNIRYSPWVVNTSTPDKVFDWTLARANVI